MNKFTTLLISFAWGTCAACSSNKDEPIVSPPTPSSNEVVVFQDEFNIFNNSVWTKETHAAGWTNQELQSYDAAHVTVGKDGEKTVLILTAERKNGLIMSGRVNTKSKKSFKYGKLEASIKLPKTANGLWPALWLMGNNNKE